MATSEGVGGVNFLPAHPSAYAITVLMGITNRPFQPAANASYPTLRSTPLHPAPLLTPSHPTPVHHSILLCVVAIAQTIRKITEKQHMVRCYNLIHVD